MQKDKIIINSIIPVLGGWRVEFEYKFILGARINIPGDKPTEDEIKDKIIEVLQ